MSYRILLAALWETLSVTLRYPAGEGLSSLTVNVLWGFSNFVFAYLLLVRVGHFDPRSIACVAPFAAGALLISLQMARHFGELHGGNTPGRP